MKWRQKYSKIIIEVTCLLFIILFVYAAISKLLDFETFRVQIGQSPLLTSFAGWVAWVIPLLELVVAFILVIPKYRLPALYGCLGLMSLFTMYIIAILNFSDYVPCSCGGILEKLGWREHLIFNIVFVVLAIVGIFFESDKPTNQQEIIHKHI